MRYVLLACLLLLPLAALAQGPTTIGGVAYDRIDPGEPFAAMPRPAQDWTAPAASAAEKAAGMMAYVTPDPGDYKPWRILKAEERVSRLTAFLTPGEDEPVCFGVYGLQALPGLQVKVNLGSAPLTVDTRHEHFWPQRTGWRSRQWYMTPELLLPCRDGKKLIPARRGVLQEVPFDLPAGETAAFWLTLSAPAGAKPGIYQAAVSVSAAGRTPLLLPLEIEVLPFKLVQPADRSWLLYGDAARWGGMNDAQILAEMKDYARHGMTGLIEIGLGQPDLSRLKEGKVTYDATTYRRWAKLGAQAGMPGPHVIGSAGAGAVRDVVAPGTNLERGEWPAVVKDGVAAVARAAMDATRDVPRWYYYGVDEPTGENTYAIQDYQAWHAGGAKTYATFYVISFLEKASQFLTAPCFVTGLISNEQTAREAREACAKTGAEFWWYGTGSYVNPFPQEGYMWHNRYGAGLLFWKTGAKAEATWTFCRPHEDVFNDFDGSQANGAEPKEQCTAYPHFLKPDDWSTYQGAIPTIAWESLREGVDDYKYLYTLQQEIARHPGAAAQQAEAELQALVGAVPWRNPMGPVGFESRRLQQIRRAVADRISALQSQGGTAGAAAPGSYGLTLNLTTSAPVAKAGLPVVSILPASRPPTVDGKLTDAAWNASAVAGDFVEISTGQPAKLPTSARILADDQALYVAFECPEPAMKDVQAREKAHDGTVWLEDGVEFFVAGASRKPYAHLIITSAGVVLDEANQDSQAWNPKFPLALDKQADRWTVEFALPWTELAKAGVSRAATMTLNFGRTRHTGGDPQTHTAWSCTYGGFHVPERFGLGLLQQGRLALTGLSLPSLWGRGAVTAALRNDGPATMQAAVAVRGAGARTVALAPGATQTVALPANLRRAGDRRLELTWGAEGQFDPPVSLLTRVPEPIVLGEGGGLVSPGATVPLALTVNLAPAEWARHRLQVQVSDARSTRTYEVPAEPGQKLRLPLCLSGMARVQVRLLDSAGKALWESEPQPYLALGD